MRLGHRIEVINEGFFYPQARAIIGRNDPDRINSIVKGLRLKPLQYLTQPPSIRPTVTLTLSLPQKRDHHASSQQALTDA